MHEDFLHKETYWREGSLLQEWQFRLRLKKKLKIKGYRPKVRVKGKKRNKK